MIQLLFAISFAFTFELGLDLGEKTEVKRRPASAGTFITPEKSCSFYEDEQHTQELGQVRAGRKIWVEDHGANYVIFRKVGQAYLPKSCLN